MQNGNYLFETTTRLFHTFELQNPSFHCFFYDNAIVKKTYAPDDKIDELLNKKTVGYISRGFCKTYVQNTQGENHFTGFLPCYSTFHSAPGIDILNKILYAGCETEIIYCILDEYLSWISISSDRMLHMMNEPYYRRNLNDFPRYETINQSSKYKVYFYIYYYTLRFGTPASNQSKIIKVKVLPTYKDIAYYYGLHPNNVASYLAELRKICTIEKKEKYLYYINLTELESMLTKLKK